MTIHYKTGEKDKRPWGEWETIHVGEKHVIKQITVHPKGKISLQKHNYRNEHWIIVHGSALVTLNEKQFQCNENEHIFIPCKSIHRVENNTAEPLVFIEIQMGDILDENDIIRIEDIYNRI